MKKLQNYSHKCRQEKPAYWMFHGRIHYYLLYVALSYARARFSCRRYVRPSVTCWYWPLVVNQWTHDHAVFTIQWPRESFLLIPTFVP